MSSMIVSEKKEELERSWQAESRQTILQLKIVADVVVLMAFRAFYLIVFHSTLIIFFYQSNMRNICFYK
ncbi:CLUMA_CG004739, isoform A [Clunio marinus]|uniref:CLUMA_CG004739, isoform A n=1 Tax=Clunio marinus TaxID=568069 RepID=A0A1J1HST0_9DIPT|nr:CLUMA_CG004739, isoform A [Clunio marinus]